MLQVFGVREPLSCQSHPFGVSIYFIFLSDYLVYFFLGFVVCKTFCIQVTHTRMRLSRQDSQRLVLALF